jgi:antitoxin (DNA-binding transcriptional repressor) of toxin-antitoxin stability system
MKTITAAQANRQFSKMLAGVLQGEVFTVVSRGTPVATMGPVAAPGSPRMSARAALMVRLKAQKPRKVGGSNSTPRSWTRDDLYAD